MNTPSDLFLPWSPEFSISNKQIDAEHEKILMLFNDLHLLYRSHSNFHILSEKFTQLIEEVRQHFLSEEKILINLLPQEKFKYHKELHKNLVKQIADFYFTFDDSKVLSNDFFTFFKIWFTADIIGADRECLSSPR